MSSYQLSSTTAVWHGHYIRFQSKLLPYWYLSSIVCNSLADTTIIHLPNKILCFNWSTFTGFITRPKIPKHQTNKNIKFQVTVHTHTHYKHMYFYTCYTNITNIVRAHAHMDEQSNAHLIHTIIPHLSQCSCSMQQPFWSVSANTPVMTVTLLFTWYLNKLHCVNLSTHPRPNHQAVHTRVPLTDFL